VSTLKKLKEIEDEIKMNYEIKNGLLKMQGFDIGNKILISDADEVIFSNEENGTYTNAKEVEVIIEIETLKTWIEEYGLLDDIEIENY
jgi:hypothetical protein